jgi:hypothetical protein
MTWAIWDNLMNFDITNFQALVRHLPVEGEVCDLAHAEVLTQTEINTEIAPLIQQVAAALISEIDRLTTDLQQVRNHLQSEGERDGRRRTSNFFWRRCDDFEICKDAINTGA